MSESRIVYECMNLLGKFGAVYRTNAGQYFTKDGKPISGLPKGFSDILFIKPGGQACFLEIKSDKGKPTPEQVEFISKMQSLGALAGIARNPTEAAKICGIVG